MSKAASQEAGERWSCPDRKSYHNTAYSGNTNRKDFGRTVGRPRLTRRRRFRNYNAPTNSRSEDAMVCHGFKNSTILVEDVRRSTGNEEDRSENSSCSSTENLDDNHPCGRHDASKQSCSHQRVNIVNDHVNLIHAPEALRSEYISMDCEMVGTGPYGKRSVLARVSLVDWYGQILLDTFVKVYDTVTDLRTFVSGVTLEKILPDSPYAMEYEECVDLVKRSIYGKVLVGHGLENDLDALGISHPWYDIRDTAKYEPFMKVRGGYLVPRKLRELAEEKMGVIVQTSDSGHDSIEDAWAAMQLYKLVGAKWDEIMEYNALTSVATVRY